MKNVKDEVFAALQAVCDNVSDVYPTSWVDLPAIQYTEEENRVYERTANKEDKASVRYRIDIWNSGSTSGMAQAAAMSRIHPACDINRCVMKVSLTWIPILCIGTVTIIKGGM